MSTHRKSESKPARDTENSLDRMTRALEKGDGCALSNEYAKMSYWDKYSTLMQIAAHNEDRRQHNPNLASLTITSGSKQWSTGTDAFKFAGVGGEQNSSSEIVALSHSKAGQPVEQGKPIAWANQSEWGGIKPGSLGYEPEHKQESAGCRNLNDNSPAQTVVPK